MKTTETDQMPIKEQIPVLGTIALTPPPAEKGEARVMHMRNYDILNDKKVLGYLHHTLLRYRQTLNTTNAGWSYRISYTNRGKIFIVTKSHLQLNYRDKSLTTTVMDLWVVLHASMGHYRRSFRRLFEHIYYITRFTQHWQDIRVKDICMTWCNANIMWPHISNEIYTIGRDCHECVRHKSPQKPRHPLLSVRRSWLQPSRGLVRQLCILRHYS